MTTTNSSRKLTVADISDVRAYERERPAFRARIIELKRVRRVELGPFVSVAFENRETVRYQIQEMARVERLATDDAILEELTAYNPLIPEPGQLCCTLFIELTSDESMREWLPKLVGIERSLVLCAADGSSVRAEPEAQHASMLTRDHITAAVHFLQFEVPAPMVAAMSVGPVVLELDLPAYCEAAELSPATLSELLADLRQE